MLEYSDDPACSHSPHSSSYSIAGKLLHCLQKGSLFCRVRVPHALCTHIQDVVWCMTGRNDGGCLSLHSGKTGDRVSPLVFYSCCRWTVEDYDPKIFVALHTFQRLARVEGTFRHNRIKKFQYGTIPILSKEQVVISSQWMPSWSESEMSNT